MIELIKISFDNFNIVMFCSPYIWGLVIVSAVIYAIYKFLLKKSFSKTEVDIDEVELGIGNQKLKIKPNYQTIQVAYKLWVELNTRKLGLPIDEENDVISEVYDSWYAFFGIARELIKEIPAQKASNKDTKELIILSSKILNNAVRPHLTKWQARYREWYKRYTSNAMNYDISPQETQRKFKCKDDKDCYASLMQDMKDVNKKLISYRKILESIVFGAELKEVDILDTSVKAEK